MSGAVSGGAPWLNNTPTEAPTAPRKPRQADPVTPATRAIVRGRSGGVCELEGCDSPATHVHHRQLRRHGRHGASNLLHTCGPCHTRIHGHVRYSMDVGWIVSAYDEPLLREALINGDWVWLGEDGTLTHRPPGSEVQEPPC